MDGEVHRREDLSQQYPQNYPTPTGKDIKVNPDNFDEMVKKLTQRDKEREKSYEEKLRSKTTAEAIARFEPQHEVSAKDKKELSSKKIVKRALRTAGDHKPLSDRTVIREPKSGEIQDLKKRLNDEIKEVGQRIFKEMPKDQLSSLEKKLPDLKTLKGRISKTD